MKLKTSYAGQQVVVLRAEESLDDYVGKLFTDKSGDFFVIGLDERGNACPFWVGEEGVYEGATSVHWPLTLCPVGTKITIIQD